MPKDPSVLFYTQDFLMGSSLLTPLQKGHYITLLCYQQQSETGSLSLDEIKLIMGEDFLRQWPAIKKKFQEDNNGFFNVRMRSEMARRKGYSESRRGNRLSKKVDKEETYEHSYDDTHDTSYDKTHEQSYDNDMSGHMENDNENRIENRIENEIENKNGVEKIFIVPEMQKIFLKYNPTYPADQERDYPPLRSISDFLAKLPRGDLPKDEFTLSVWDKICYINSTGFYASKSLKTISTHIQNVYQEYLNPTKKNGQSNGKDQTAIDLLEKTRKLAQSYRGRESDAGG